MVLRRKVLIYPGWVNYTCNMNENGLCKHQQREEKALSSVHMFIVLPTYISAFLGQNINNKNIT